MNYIDSTGSQSESGTGAAAQGELIQGASHTAGLQPRRTVTMGGDWSGSEMASNLITQTPTGSESRQKATERASKSKVVPPAIAHRIYGHFDVCLDAIERAKSEDNPILRENAFAEFVGALDSLWGCRAAREDEFAEAINMLQGVVAGRHRIDFSDARLDSLFHAVSTLRDEPTFGELLLNDVTEALIRDGIDVFRELN